MPKAPRTPKEIETVRRDIMDKALELIVTEGYDGFTMRKLAARLKVTPKTIYNYFQNQDEIYLRILTKGFEQLYGHYEKAAEQHQDPSDKIRAAIAAYIEFGLENPNIYNLMFTWHVPKFNDYVGTPMESVAQQELDTALKCHDYTMYLFREYLGDSAIVEENKIKEEIVYNWSQMHGYIAGVNNTLLDYMLENPISLKKKIIERAARNIQSAIAGLLNKSS